MPSMWQSLGRVCDIHALRFGGKEGSWNASTFKFLGKHRPHVAAKLDGSKKMWHLTRLHHMMHAEFHQHFPYTHGIPISKVCHQPLTPIVIFLQVNDPHARCPGPWPGTASSLRKAHCQWRRGTQQTRVLHVHWRMVTLSAGVCSLKGGWNPDQRF